MSVIIFLRVQIYEAIRLFSGSLLAMFSFLLISQVFCAAAGVVMSRSLVTTLIKKLKKEQKTNEDSEQ